MPPFNESKILLTNNTIDQSDGAMPDRFVLLGKQPGLAGQQPVIPVVKPFCFRYN